MRFVIYILFGLIAANAWGAGSADPLPGIEGLKQLFEGSDPETKKVSSCDPKEKAGADQAACQSAAKAKKTKCDSAVARVAEVDAEAAAALKGLTVNAKENAGICEQWTSKLAQAYDLAQQVCQSCADSCNSVCNTAEICDKLTDSSRIVDCHQKLGTIKANDCGLKGKSMAPNASSMAGKAGEFASAKPTSIADSGKCAASGAGAGDDTDPAKPKDGENPDGGGGQGQPPQQQSQQDPQNQKDAGDEGADTKKDAKGGGGAGGMDPSALAELMKPKEDEKEKEVDCAKEEAPYLKQKCFDGVLKACTSGDAATAGTGGCKSFARHYCYKSSKPDLADTTPSGGGVGTDYCNDTVMGDFCADATRNSLCAGCKYRAAKQACATAGNPVGCAADPSCSTAQTAAAGGLTVCLQDPYLLSATYMSSCVSSVATGTAGFTNSTPSTGLSPSSAGGGGGMSGMATSVAAAAAEAEADDTGNREGLNLAVSSQGGYSQGAESDVVGDEGGGGGGTKAKGRGLAGASGMTTASAMPTDVATAMGPNTFSIISSVLKVRCDSFKHLHCEPH